MPETPDELEKLLTEVRKTISDNRQFLEKLVDEALEIDSEDDSESVASDGDYEEL